jgi:hypothetical protein
MLSLKSFQEAWHKRKIVPFVIMQDVFRMADIGLGVLEREAVDLEYMRIVSQKNEEDLPSFEDYLGGDVNIVETEEDLKKITNCDLDFADKHGGRWPDVTDMPMVWDDCRKLDEEWALFFAAWTDAGGNTYYVPRKFWEQIDLDSHVRLTQESQQ